MAAHIRKLNTSRAFRREMGEFVCDGPKLLEEALRWGGRITTVLYEAGRELPAGLPDELRVVQAPADLLRSLSTTQTPQGLLFLCRMPQTDLPERLEGSRYLVLDGVQDPGNVGTVLRTADAFGADGLILLPGCADPFSPKTVRASMGACFRLPVWEAGRQELAAAAAGAGLPLYGAALGENTGDVRDVDLRRCAVVIGSEGRGISGETLELCTGTIRIPMRERCESLNAAVAAAVILWEGWRAT